MLPTPSFDRDIALRDRIVRGERDALDALLGDHLDALYEFVHYRMGGDRARSEDVVHDTMLVAFQRMRGFDGKSSLYTWLCGIAKNKIRSARRVRAPRPLADVLEESEGDIDAILADVAREPLPHEVLEREETRDLVGATLSSLPDDYRRALLEKYVQGLSVNEMAARTGKTEKATESVLTRARNAFARVFELYAKRRGGIE